MEIFRRLEDFARRHDGCVATVGKFDGLHRGHAAIFRKTIERARALGVPSLVFTFDPTPAEILRPESVPPTLCDRELKIELFEAFGLDAVLFFPTDRSFLNLTARDFFRTILVDALGVKAVVEGDNFRFGRDQEGSDAALAEYCREYGVELEVADLIGGGSAHASCSRVREALKMGDVTGASEQLGRFYSLRGIVEHGDGRGTGLGFATANLGSTTTLIPGPGVYAASAKTDDGKLYPAAVNLGGNPTFGVSEIKIEAHLLDYQGEPLYGRPLRLDFLKRLRDIVDFSARPERLIPQILNDVDQTRKIFARSLQALSDCFENDVRSAR